MVTRQPWNSKHRNPSKVHRQRLANKKATTGIVQLVSSSVKLSGKAAKKIEKKVRRAEREKQEAEKVASEPPPPAAAATPATASSSSSSAPSRSAKKSSKSVGGDDAMDVDEIITSKPRARITEIRRGRKSKTDAMSDD